MGGGCIYQLKTSFKVVNLMDGNEVVNLMDSNKVVNIDGSNYLQRLAAGRAKTATKDNR